MSLVYTVSRQWNHNRRLQRAVLSACVGINAVVLPTCAAFADTSSAETDTTDASDAADAGRKSGRLLETVTVTGRVTTPAEQLRAEVEKVPGAVAVIDNTEIERGRDSTLEDVLTLQPGIFAQSTSGTEANKVTIRGSGLNTFYGGYALGITYLYNGIPITGAAGTQEDLLSMHAVNSTTVLYGANAFDYSATSLGGAINFVLDNGYTSPGLYLRTEFGSYQYQKEQLSYGVGESGSGKSTTARLVLGLCEPDHGSVRFGGSEWNAAPPHGVSERLRRPRRGEMGVLYQDPLSSFDPRWSVAQIVGDALRPDERGGNRDEQIIDLLHQVRLGADVMQRRPLHLSGGQRQRVAIARAIAHRPRLIVCDEPVSALDVSVQSQVLDLLADLQAELGIAYVFISHDLGVIRRVSDEVLVMLQGRVVERGPTEQLFI